MGGYFTYKRLASTGGKVAGFQLATSSWQEKIFPRRFFRVKVEKDSEFKYSGNSETSPRARCEQHEVRQLRCWR